MCYHYMQKVLYCCKHATKQDAHIKDTYNRHMMNMLKQRQCHNHDRAAYDSTLPRIDTFS